MNDKTVVREENYDKYNARYAYESLILQQPQVEFRGLWLAKDRYYAVCPSLASNPLARSGEGLKNWFDNKCRPIVSPIELVTKAPTDAVKINLRTAAELSQLHGEPLTISDIYREIYSALPKTFPLKYIGAAHGKIQVYVERNLSDIEDSVLHIAFSNIGMTHDIEVKPFTTPEPEKVVYAAVKGADSLSLISSRSLATKGAIHLQRSCEEDEEFWIDKRLDIFSNGSLTAKDMLPERFKKADSCCFIDATAFEPKNIRIYLPLYQRIIIAMPLAESFDSAIRAFGVTKPELLELVRRGRVQFILPQSMERYPLSFISDLIEVNSEAVLFSRRLAAASVCEARRRVPLLYPPMGTQERRGILELFTQIKDPGFGPIAKIISEGLGTSWVGMESNLSSRGAMGVANHGIAPVLGELYHHLSGRDVRLEILFGAMSIEWSSALGATYCPVDAGGYSDAKTAHLCASIYSGVSSVPLVNPIQDLEVFIGGLLTLNNDAPVLEVDQVFSTKDIEKLGKLINGIGIDENPSIILSAMNSKVEKFESNTNRLKRLDILGLGGAAAATAITGSIYVPFAMWALKYVLLDADSSKDFGGGVLDWVRAINSMTSPNAVLVSRLREKIQSL